MYKVTVFLPDGKTIIFEEGKKNVETIEIDMEGSPQVTIDMKDDRRKIYGGMPFIFERLLLK